MAIVFLRIVRVALYHGHHISADNPCPIYQHTCDERRCVDRQRLCDGRRDCLDQSDEANCGSKHSVCLSVRPSV